MAEYELVDLGGTQVNKWLAVIDDVRSNDALVEGIVAGRAVRVGEASTEGQARNSKRRLALAAAQKGVEWRMKMKRDGEVHGLYIISKGESTQ